MGRIVKTRAAPAPTPIRPDSCLAREFWETGRCVSCPVYDMHGHMGVWRSIHFPAAGPDAMVRHMDRAGVRLLCFAHHGALFCPEEGNDLAIAPVRAHPGRLRAYMAINPNHPEITARDLARFDALADVFVGFKFLSDYHRTPLTHPGYAAALELADARRLPVLMHTWSGSPFNGPEQVRQVAARYPRAALLLGHSFNSDWAAAIAVAREHPSTYLELTSVLGLAGVLERFVAGVGSERLLFGTDLPWFDEFHGIGSVLGAELTDEDVHNILHRNAERLLARAEEWRAAPAAAP